MQLSTIVGFLGVMLEIMEFCGAYKYTRPYKYYNPYPLDWRSPRWHPFPKFPSKPPRHYYSERMPAYKYQDPYESEYRRYAPLYENSDDTADGDKSYIVVIQLPQKKEKQSRLYQRAHVAEPSELSREIDYIDDDKPKLYQLNDKARVKVNDRLSILTL